MDKKAIQNEISELRKIRNGWSGTRKSKSEASLLAGRIELFNDTFSVRFPNAAKHYQKNRPAEIWISDGLEELEHYSKSKLKQKDDRYFYDGIEHLEWGLDNIISDLEKELNSD